MKKYFLLFAVGLLACAGPREGLYSERDSRVISPVKISTNEFITATPAVPFSDAHRLNTQQRFDVRITITFPRMTLQQAAELEARVRKLFPEAQEIDFGLDKKIEVPTESFYYDMLDGTEFRILPGYFPLPLAPFEKFKPGSILKGDSMGIPVWQEF